MHSEVEMGKEMKEVKIIFKDGTEDVINDSSMIFTLCNHKGTPATKVTCLNMDDESCTEILISITDMLQMMGLQITVPKNAKSEDAINNILRAMYKERKDEN